MNVYELLFFVPVVAVMWLGAIAAIWVAVEHALGKLDGLLQRRKWAKEHEAQQRRLREDMT